MSYFGTHACDNSAAILHAPEKSVHNLGTNEEIICTSFSLPLRDSRDLMTVIPGQDGGPRRRYMSEQQITHPQAVIPSMEMTALKWRDLTERRRAHFIELYLTGRWKRYYSEEQFLTVFRETMTIADRWNEIAPKPGDAELQAS